MHVSEVRDFGALKFYQCKGLFSSEGDPPLVRSFQWRLDRTQNARGR